MTKGWQRRHNVKVAMAAKADHDPMCLSQEFLPDDLTRFCDCERVLRIRADERERGAAVHMDEMDNMGADLLAAIRDLDAMRMQRDAARQSLADERERLATEVEEMAPRWNDYAVPRSRVRSVVSFIRGGVWW